MNFVIPMAGKGQRFVDAGYTLPKMLVEAKGKTLLEWSVDSLPLDLCSHLVFIGLKEHEEKFHLSTFITKCYKDKCSTISFIWLNDVTRGQSETVLKAAGIIDKEKPLIIFNIDTTFHSNTLRNKIINNPEVAYLGAFKATEPRFSFAKLNNEGFVCEVAEKDPISDNALTGMYHFAKTSDFIEVAQESIAKNELIKNEFYVAPLYNKLIAKGLNFKIDVCDTYSILGTPEELEMFINED